MTDEQIKHMVERFLTWKLPADFNPDNGISAVRPNYGPNVAWEPVGTNLFDYTQAEAMVRHMVERLPALRRPSPVAESTPSPDTEGVSEEVLEAWAFNVMLECSHPDAGEKIECAIGGAVLDLRDLNRLLTWFRTAQNTGRDEVLEEAAKVADIWVDVNYAWSTPAKHTADSIAAAIRQLKSSPPISTVDEEGGGA